MATGSVDLYTEIRGEGPDLVLLHGGAGSIADLEGLRAGFVGSRRVIAPDQRGHGRTADVGEMSYEALASDTAALLDTLAVHDADIVGWSDGGILALILGVDHPERIRRVVAISANVASVGAPQAIAPAEAEWFASATAADLPIPPPDPELPERAETWPVTAGRILDMWRRGPELTLARLGTMSVPVLFVSGDRDLITLDHTVAMFRAVTDARLAVVPGATHDVPQTHVELVTRLITEFLDEPPPAGA